MSRQITPLSVVILVTIGFTVGTLTMVISNLQRNESLHKAYERGWRHGYLAGTYQVIETVDDYHPDNLMEGWEYDMRGCLGDTIVDEFLAGMVDSTDTMPAMDSELPEPLYDEIWYTDTAYVPRIVEFGHFRMDSRNINRIDTVRADIDTLHRVHRWYAQDDSTLCRYFEKTFPTTGRGADTLRCYREQVHLQRNI